MLQHLTLHQFHLLLLSGELRNPAFRFQQLPAEIIGLFAVLTHKLCFFLQRKLHLSHIVSTTTHCKEFLILLCDARKKNDKETSKVEMLTSLMRGLFLMFMARAANSSVVIVSITCCDAGVTAQMIAVRELPPSAGFRNRVSFDSRVTSAALRNEPVSLFIGCPSV